MARPLRLEFPGALYHLTSRGDAREDIFLDDTDREEFLSVLSEVVRRMNWRVHAYCLMDNHYHLVAETPEPNLSRGMRQLNGVYTQRFNRRHGRVGHVFQGRFKAILVEKDAYLLELCRYVVLNPVRAGRTATAGDFLWSSYLPTLGRSPAPEWLGTDWLLSQFSADRGAARRAYARFVAEGKGQPSVWEHLQGQIFLGGDRFLARVHRRLDPKRDLTEIPRAQRRMAKPLAAYERSHADPRRAMAEAYLSGAYTLADVARHFGVHYGTVSRAAREWEGRIGKKQAAPGKPRGRMRQYKT